MSILNITLTYTGRAANRNEIDLYDVGQALVGFQRSLALTTHLVLNDEIITQAPALKGAQIIALPAEEGNSRIYLSRALRPKLRWHCTRGDTRDYFMLRRW